MSILVIRSGAKEAARETEMSVFYSPRLVRLLMNERLREAAQARMVHEIEQGCGSERRRSILNPFRRQAPAPCAC